MQIGTDWVLSNCVIYNKIKSHEHKHVTENEHYFINIWFDFYSFYRHRLKSTKIMLNVFATLLIICEVHAEVCLCLAISSWIAWSKFALFSFLNYSFICFDWKLVLTFFSLVSEMILFPYSLLLTV